MVGGVTAMAGDDPVPLKGTLRVLPTALSVMFRMALRVPGTDGVNVTLMVVLALGATVMGSGVVVVNPNSEGFAPETAMAEITRLPVPVLVTVTGEGALGLFTGWLEKRMLVGASVTAGAPTPLPDRVTVCGLPLTLSVSESVAVRVPNPKGVNVSVMLVEAPGKTVMGSVVEPKANSEAWVPVSARLEITRLLEPVLVTVTVCGALAALRACPPKATAVGSMLIPATPTPVPESASECGEPLALSVIARMAVRRPRALGVNTTLTTVLAPGWMVTGKVNAVTA